MPARRSPPLRLAALAAPLALAACSPAGGGPKGIEDGLLAEGADPALTSALEDQILVDPNLVQQAHPNSVRPPEAPAQAQYPPPDEAARPTGPRRAALAAGIGAAGCGARFDHGPQWANRLPAEFPLYPGARLTEAAGTPSGDCRLRFIAFRTADSPERVLAHYAALARRAGFAAERQQRGADHLLGGVKAGTDGAFVLVVTPVEGGSEAALIAGPGR